MLVQISSGQGPIECELGVEKLFKSLQKEFGDLKIISFHKSKNNYFDSILFEILNHAIPLALDDGLSGFL